MNEIIIFYFILFFTSSLRVSITGFIPSVLTSKYSLLSAKEIQIANNISKKIDIFVIESPLNNEMLLIGKRPLCSFSEYIPQFSIYRNKEITSGLISVDKEVEGRLKLSETLFLHNFSVVFSDLNATYLIRTKEKDNLQFQRKYKQIPIEKTPFRFLVGTKTEFLVYSDEDNIITKKLCFSSTNYNWKSNKLLIFVSVAVILHVFIAIIRNIKIDTVQNINFWIMNSNLKLIYGTPLGSVETLHKHFIESHLIRIKSFNRTVSTVMRLKLLDDYKTKNKSSFHVFERMVIFPLKNFQNLYFILIWDEKIPKEDKITIECEIISEKQTVLKKPEITFSSFRDFKPININWKLDNIAECTLNIPSSVLTPFQPCGQVVCLTLNILNDVLKIMAKKEFPNQSFEEIMTTFLKKLPIVKRAYFFYHDDILTSQYSSDLKRFGKLTDKKEISQIYNKIKEDGKFVDGMNSWSIIHNFINVGNRCFVSKFMNYVTFFELDGGDSDVFEELGLPFLTLSALFLFQVIRSYESDFIFLEFMKLFTVTKKFSFIQIGMESHQLITCDTTLFEKPDTLAQCVGILRKADASELESIMEETRELKRKGGGILKSREMWIWLNRPFWFKVTGVVLHDDKIDEFVGSFLSEDITARKQQETENSRHLDFITKTMKGLNVFKFVIENDEIYVEQGEKLYKELGRPPIHIEIEPKQLSRNRSQTQYKPQSFPNKNDIFFKVSSDKKVNFDNNNNSGNDNNENNNNSSSKSNLFNLINMNNTNNINSNNNNANFNINNHLFEIIPSKYKLYNLSKIVDKRDIGKYRSLLHTNNNNSENNEEKVSLRLLNNNNEPIWYSLASNGYTGFMFSLNKFDEIRNHRLPDDDSLLAASASLLIFWAVEIETDEVKPLFMQPTIWDALSVDRDSKFIRFIDFVHCDDKEKFLTHFEELKQNKAEQWTDEIRILRMSGNYEWNRIVLANSTSNYNCNSNNNDENNNNEINFNFENDVKENNNNNYDNNYYNCYTNNYDNNHNNNNEFKEICREPSCRKQRVINCMALNVHKQKEIESKLAETQKLRDLLLSSGKLAIWKFTDSKTKLPRMSRFEPGLSTTVQMNWNFIEEQIHPDYKESFRDCIMNAFENCSKIVPNSANINKNISNGSMDNIFNYSSNLDSNFNSRNINCMNSNNNNNMDNFHSDNNSNNNSNSNDDTSNSNDISRLYSKREKRDLSMVSIELPIILDDNKEIWVSIRGKARSSLSEKYIFGVCIDITELRNALNELQREQRRAEEANRSKTVFFANMSHEIRTPMNGVFGILDIIALQELSSEQRLLVDSVRASSFQLMNLLDATLKLSKIETGTIDLNLSNFSLTKIFEPICIATSSAAKTNKLKLNVIIDKNFPDALYGDSQLFIQIINNLLSNAIKFTKRGSITVKLSWIVPFLQSNKEGKRRCRNDGETKFYYKIGNSNKLENKNDQNDGGKNDKIKADQKKYDQKNNDLNPNDHNKNNKNGKNDRINNDNIKSNKLTNNNSHKANNNHKDNDAINDEDSDKGSEICVLEVLDTGIGISKDQQKIIFQRFKQADPSTQRVYGGTGLGLALVNEIVQFLGGKILIDSEIGRGTKFSIHLPMKSAMFSYSPQFCDEKNHIILVSIKDRAVLESMIDWMTFHRYDVIQFDEPEEILKYSHNYINDIYKYDISSNNNNNKNNDNNNNNGNDKDRKKNAGVIDVIFVDSDTREKWPKIKEVLTELEKEQLKRRESVNIPAVCSLCDAGEQSFLDFSLTKPVLMPLLLDFVNRIRYKRTKVPSYIEDKDKNTLSENPNDSNIKCGKPNNDNTNNAINVNSVSSENKISAEIKINTASSVVNTNSNIVSTNSNIVNTNSNIVNTNSNVVNTNSNVVNTNSNVVNTNSNAVNTDPNAVNTDPNLTSNISTNNSNNKNPASGKDISSSTKDRPARILVVEDNKANQFVMQKILQKLGCAFRIAENGQEAIDALDEEEIKLSSQTSQTSDFGDKHDEHENEKVGEEKHADEEVAGFDLVFMDCQMPVLDGIQATKIIRASVGKKYATIPIIALTASAVEGDEQTCRGAGMDDYLAKPVRIQQITNAIKQFIPF